MHFLIRHTTMFEKYLSNLPKGIAKLWCQITKIKFWNHLAKGLSSPPPPSLTSRQTRDVVYHLWENRHSSQTIRQKTNRTKLIFSIFRYKNTRPLTASLPHLEADVKKNRYFFLHIHLTKGSWFSEEYSNCSYIFGKCFIFSSSLNKISISLNKISINLNKISISPNKISINLNKININLTKISINRTKISINLNKIIVSM